MKKYVLGIERLVVVFLMAIIILSTMIGVLCAFFNFSWNHITVTFVLVLSAIATMLIMKTTILDLHTWEEAFALGVVIAGTILIYGQFSPVLEIRQDPALYLFKSMNLINYGYIYKPMPIFTELLENGIININADNAIMKNGFWYDYAMIQNGTSFLDGKLYPDFFAGGSFVYALFGVIKKEWCFWGPMVIMICNGSMLFDIFKKFLYKRNFSNVCFSLAFLISPVIVWFGRSTFSEPMALFVVLAVIDLLLYMEEKEYSMCVNILMFTFLVSYTIRMDYLSMLLLGIFIVMWCDYKKGIIYTVLSILIIEITDKTFWIYSYRIAKNNLPILGYRKVLVIGFAIICFFLVIRIKDFIEKIYYSRFISIILTVLSIGITLLIFWNNLVSQYQYAQIHEQNLMTYREFILDLLCLVFPPIVLIGGILLMPVLVKNRNISILAGIFIIGMFVGYSYLFIGAGNSPQLYWILRRYYNVTLPIVTIAFVLGIESLEKKAFSIIAMACLMISCNLFVESSQIADYKNLNEGVKMIETQLEGVDTIFYLEEDRYNVSPLLSYTDKEFVPLKSEDIVNVYNYLKLNQSESVRNMVIISSENLKNQEYIGSVEYLKMGETYGAIPKEVYYRQIDYYIDKIDHFCEQ